MAPILPQMLTRKGPRPLGRIVDEQLLGTEWSVANQ